MWYSGTKHISATDAWFYKGKPNAKLQWHRRVGPSNPKFLAAGFVPHLSFSPSAYLMWSLRCSIVASKSVSLAVAAYYKTLSIITQIQDNTSDFVLKPEAKSWKDFIVSGNTGALGACISAMYMDACGLSWFGHWEHIFSSQPPGAAPDFVFTNKFSLSLCEAKGTTSVSRHNPKNGWRDQIHPRLGANPFIADGTCLSVLMPHGTQAKMSIATNRNSSPTPASAGLASAVIASHYGGMARLAGLDSLHAAIERRLADKDVAVRDGEMKTLALGRQRYVYGREIKLFNNTRLICAMPLRHAEKIFRYTEGSQGDLMDINPEKESPLQRPIWSDEMHHFSDGMTFLICRFVPRTSNPVVWDSNRQGIVAASGRGNPRAVD